MQYFVFPNNDLHNFECSDGFIKCHNTIDLRKVIDFLIKTNCEFTYKDMTVFLNNAELIPVHKFSDTTKKGWDFLILSKDCNI